MNFKIEILANFEFLRYQIVKPFVRKILAFHSHFQLKSEQKGKPLIFSKKLIQIAQNSYQRTKIDQ